MALRDLTTIINDAIAFITGKRPNIATFPGSVVRDVVIEAPAQEFNNVYTELSHTQQLQSLVYATSMSTQELDALGSNYGLTRLPGRQASGTVTFQVRLFSSSSTTISIPSGTAVSTQGTSSVPQVAFVTTAAITFLPSQAPIYFNSVTGFYEQTVPIVSQTIGAVNNVAAGTITRFLSTVPGVDRLVNNIATTGGVDIESNADFAARIILKLSGNNVGTATGILSLVRNNANVIDAIIVTPNDVEMLRSQFGGEVDVYILGAINTPISDTHNYQVTGTQSFVMAHQPVSLVSSITGIASGVPYNFIENTDYIVIFDPSTLLNGSTKLQTKIEFLGSGTLPDNNTNFTINYVYDSLIEELQLEIDNSSAHIVTADVLVKEAAKATIDINADISILPGFGTSTIAAVQTALTNFINALGLGKSIDRSDIVTVIENVPGIDSVDLNTLQIFKNAVIVPPTTQRITIFKTEYAATGTLNITIV